MQQSANPLRAAFYRGLCKQLIRFLADHQVSQKTQDAFWQVPRHLFVNGDLYYKAYKDCALPIGANQTISRPLTVAHQTDLLQVERADKILEIGTGSGFQTMILAALGANVYTVERQKVLYDRARNHTLVKQFPSIKFFFGDGFVGLPQFRPFDKILVTAGASEIPYHLLDQLREGGIMVIPVGTSENQTMTKVTKTADQPCIETFGDFTFVPMLKGLRNQPERPNRFL